MLHRTPPTAVPKWWWVWWGFPNAWHTACDTGDVPAHQLVAVIVHWRWLVADERRMTESILGYPQWEPEMGISATPALPAILAVGWEEHHKS